MHPNVHYHHAKFEIKIQLVCGETKKTNCIMGQNELNGIVQGGKLDKVIVQGVIRTLAIVDENNLDFFLKIIPANMV